MKYRVLSAKRHSDHADTVVIEWLPNWIERLFGAKQRTCSYVGRASAWYELPDYLRVIEVEPMCNAVDIARIKKASRAQC